MLINPSYLRPRHTLYLLLIATIIGVLLGTAIAFFSPDIVIVALIILLAVVLVLKNPVLGILSLIALTSTVLDSVSNPGISLGFGHIYLTDIILFTMFCLIGWELLTHLEAKFVRTSYDVPLLVFVGVTFISAMVAISRGHITFKGVLGPMRDIFNLLIFFAVTNLIKNRKQLRLLQRSIIAFACVVSVVMVAQYFLGTTLPFLPGRVETLSTEGTRFYSVTRIIPPGYSITFIAFVTVASIWFFDKEQSSNILLTIPLALTGIGVLLTFKRHFWGALVIIFAIMVLISNRKELQRILLRGLSTTAIMLVGLFFIMNYTGSFGPKLVSSSADRMFSLLRSDTYNDPNSSLRWRDFENQYARIQIRSHPFIGIGLGANYRPWVPDKDWSGYDGRGYIHSGFYWLLLRTGGIGFLAMMGIVIGSIIRGFKYWREVPNGAYLIGFTLGIIGMLIGNWVEPLISEWYWTALTATMLGANELTIRFANNKA